MASNDSDDYEILPMQELEDLRREVHALKRNNLTEGDKAKILIEGIDRLTISINRLITILDDANKDIIDEYQQAKPVETLHQLSEQNEMIAKALLSISDNLNGGKSVVFPSAYSGGEQQQEQGNPRSILPTSFNSNFNSNQPQQMGMNMQNQMGNPNMQGMPGPGPQMQQMRQNPNMYNMQNMRMNQMPNAPQGISMPPMDDMPPMDTMPPLNPQNPDPKKKFLGIL
ncbi:MAG TPA: hypothetical protein VEC16_06290 [Alphaproteobacteria bacterium]|nr:hypothetical protein [Alphaproteobacteria bacterium]